MEKGQQRISEETVKAVEKYAKELQKFNNLLNESLIKDGIKTEMIEVDTSKWSFDLKVHSAIRRALLYLEYRTQMIEKEFKDK